MSEIRIPRMSDDPVTLAHQTWACVFFCIPFINGVELVKWTVEMYTPHVHALLRFVYVDWCFMARGRAALQWLFLEEQVFLWHCWSCRGDIFSRPVSRSMSSCQPDPAVSDVWTQSKQCSGQIARSIRDLMWKIHIAFHLNVLLELLAICLI